MNPEKRLEMLEERLEKMERELAVSRRRTRRLWISLGLAGVVCAIVWSLTATTGSAQAQGAEKVIRANQFIVEDENGKVRAVLRATKDGPGLALKDENGNVRAWIAVDKEGTGLWLYDEKGKNDKPRAELSAFKEGPRLALSDENGQDRTELGVGRTKTPDGRTITYPESSIRLYKPDGKVLWSAP